MKGLFRIHTAELSKHPAIGHAVSEAGAALEISKAPPLLPVRPQSRQVFTLVEGVSRATNGLHLEALSRIDTSLRQSWSDNNEPMRSPNPNRS